MSRKSEILGCITDGFWGDQESVRMNVAKMAEGLIHLIFADGGEIQGSNVQSMPMPTRATLYRIANGGDPNMTWTVNSGNDTITVRMGDEIYHDGMKWVKFN